MLLGQLYGAVVHTRLKARAAICLALMCNRARARALLVPGAQMPFGLHPQASKRARLQGIRRSGKQGSGVTAIASCGGNRRRGDLSRVSHEAFGIGHCATCFMLV